MSNDQERAQEHESVGNEMKTGKMVSFDVGQNRSYADIVKTGLDQNSIDANKR